MKQKRGKTSVIGFRAGRLLEDLITDSGLSVAYLVEVGLASHCKIPGPQSEMIINGAISIIDHQISELQERKNNLLNLKSAIPQTAPQQHAAQITPAKFYNQNELLFVKNKKNGEEYEMTRKQYENHKNKETLEIFIPED